MAHANMGKEDATGSRRLQPRAAFVAVIPLLAAACKGMFFAILVDDRHAPPKSPIEAQVELVVR